MTKETKYKLFEEGDKVWLEGTHLRLPYKTMKLAPRQYGPFKVAAKISDVAYKLKLPDTWKIHNIFHTSLLTPYKETEKYSPNFLEPPPELIDREPKWEVEQILGDWTYRHKKQFLIRWKGYAPTHDSWVDESDINTTDLLTGYKQHTVGKVLSQLNQSASQSAAQLSPQSATSLSHQSAQISAQSSKPKCQRKTYIRVFEPDNETSSPLPTFPPKNQSNPFLRHSPHPSYALPEPHSPYPSYTTPSHLSRIKHPNPTNPQQSCRRERHHCFDDTAPDHPDPDNHPLSRNPRESCGRECRRGTALQHLEKALGESIQELHS
jgi:hypothetical protein